MIPKIKRFFPVLSSNRLITADEHCIQKPIFIVKGDENCAVPLTVTIDLCFYLVSISLKYFDWLHTLIPHFYATMRIFTEDQNLAHPSSPKKMTGVKLNSP